MERERRREEGRRVGNRKVTEEAKVNIEREREGENIEREGGGGREGGRGTEALCPLHRTRESTLTWL